MQNNPHSRRGREIFPAFLGKMRKKKKKKKKGEFLLRKKVVPKRPQAFRNYK